MKIVKILAIVLVVGVAIFFGYGATLPTDYHVKRDIMINAPVEVVFPQVDILKNNEAWSPWTVQDPTIRSTYSGAEAGEGAVVSWTSDKDGGGTMTVTKSIANERIEIHLDFGDMGQGDAYWEFHPMEGGTHTVWGFTTTIEPIPMRYFGLKMDDMVGGAYADGLQRLKALAESLPVPAPEMPEDVSGAVTDATEAPAEITEAQ